MKRPRNLSLVRFKPPGTPTKADHDYPFSANETYLYIGELANMPEHCVVAETTTGRIFTGYHTDNFVEIPEDEV